MRQQCTFHTSAMELNVDSASVGPVWGAVCSMQYGGVAVDLFRNALNFLTAQVLVQ